MGRAVRVLLATARVRAIGCVTKAKAAPIRRYDGNRYL